ncbi:hypothetical protein [Nonomuraea sp. NPDC049158]|uniref:hypothetical protein n=1 Tax=Nonomuraea sp. NPDC049158 TaxID=3155649 RepID=UPI0033F57596
MALFRRSTGSGLVLRVAQYLFGEQVAEVRDSYGAGVETSTKADPVVEPHRHAGPPVERAQAGDQGFLDEAIEFLFQMRHERGNGLLDDVVGDHGGGGPVRRIRQQAAHSRQSFAPQVQAVDPDRETVNENGYFNALKTPVADLHAAGPPNHDQSRVVRVLPRE